MSSTERIWRGFPAGQQSALNGPAVLCSFWCPSARWAAGLCQREGRQSLSTLHTVTMPAFTRGSIQRWPTGSRITGESICSNQGRASAPSSGFLLGTWSTSIQPPRLARPNPAWLPCGWPRGPQGGVDGLGVPAWMHCERARWQWRVGLLTEHWGGAM